MMFWLRKLVLGKNKFKLIFEVLSKKSFRYFREAIFLIKHPYNVDLLNIRPTQEPLLVDIGAFEGNFAELFSMKHKNSKMVLVEPIAEFAEILRKKFPKETTKVIQHALTRDGGSVVLYVSDANTSTAKQANAKKIEVDALSVVEFAQRVEGQVISLFQINCEGAEYELIPEIVKTGLINQIETLNIQFHYLSLRNAIRHRKIRTQLSQTHRLLWSTYFIWEQWERIPGSHNSIQEVGQ